MIINNESFNILTNTSFVKIPHSAINDVRLSDGALRLLLTILSNRDGFEFGTKVSLMRKSNIKKNETFDKRVNELQNLGYLVINNNTWMLTHPKYVYKK